MAIPLNVVNRYIRTTDGDEQRYVPVISGAGVVDIETIAQEVSDKCTVTRADVQAVMTELEEYVGDQLLQGKSVRMHMLGSFRTTLSSQGASTEKEFNSAYIRGVNIRYSPSTYLNHALDRRRLQFEKCRALLILQRKEKE